LHLRITVSVAAVTLVTLASLAATASGSQLIDRNATNVRLAVSKNGNKALLTYRARGKTRHVFVSGAVNALTPTEGVPQVKFDVDYTGGLATVHRRAWKKFKNRCRPYDGPSLPFLVVACTAPDGSYWAVQAWQYWLPLLGFSPWTTLQSAYALHVSHWTGPTAQLDVWTDWINTKHPTQAFHHLFGHLTYGGANVYGFGTTRDGQPTDGYGRVVYIDTLDSAYGAGWLRETGIVTRNPSGVFCHAFVPQDPYAGYPQTGKRPPGVGTHYRVTVEGPGVTPDVSWEGPDPGPWDPGNPAAVQHESNANTIAAQVAATAPPCLRLEGLG
jgi:hypothetical protein